MSRRLALSFSSSSEDQVSEPALSEDSMLDVSNLDASLELSSALDLLDSALELLKSLSGSFIPLLSFFSLTAAFGYYGESSFGSETTGLALSGTATSTLILFLFESAGLDFCLIEEITLTGNPSLRLTLGMTNELSLILCPMV